MVDIESVTVSLSIFSISSIALVSYVIALVAIVRVRKSTKYDFYLFMFAMGVSDTTMLSFFTFYSTAAVLIQERPFGDVVDSVLFGFIANVTYFGSICMLANIAVNRYMAICRKGAQKWMLCRKKILLSMLGSIGCGAVSALPQLTPCCLFRFYPAQYSWGYDMILAGNQIFVWYDRSLSSASFLCMVISYSLIWRKVRKTRKVVEGPSTSTSNKNITKMNARQKANVRLAVQMTIISGLFIVLDFYGTIVPMITDGKWWNFLSTLLYIFTIGIHPFLYFKFNPQIREQAAIIVRCKKQIQPNQLFTPVSNVTSFRQVKRATPAKGAITFVQKY